MDVVSSNAKIWRKDVEGKNGVFHKYSVSVSKKTPEGKYVNAYIPVQFSKRANAPEKIPNGTVCDFRGFMSVESYTDRDGATKNTPMIVIMSVEFDDPTIDVDSFNKAEDDISF